MTASPLVLTLLVGACLSSCFGNVVDHLHSNRGLRGLRRGPTVGLDKVAIRQSMEELHIAQTAAIQAGNSAKDAKASQQHLAAEQAIVNAHENWLKLEPLTPEARAQLLEVRKQETLAEMH